MKKYFVKTFGCQQNERDSEDIEVFYKTLGYRPVKKWEEADEIVINTCSVRRSAEDRVYGLLNNIAKFKVPQIIFKEDFRGKQSSKCKVECKVKSLKLKTIILTGCMLGLYGEEKLRERMSMVDEFVRSDTWRRKLNNCGQKIIERQGKKEAYVNIMSGCDNFCTYCVVPYARGRERSRPIVEVIDEVRKLVKEGATEVMLLGQNVNSYGKSAKCKVKSEKLQFKVKSFITKYKAPFAVLLEKLNEIKELKKISFMTSNPWGFTDDIIEAIALPKIDRYLHLPVQSGDDEILARMNRKYTRKKYFDLINKIRKKIPEMEFGTDVIVGFPGETEKQFENTVDLCKKVGFNVGFIAMYSPRPKTAAFKLKDDVSYEEKKRRWMILDKMINKGGLFTFLLVMLLLFLLT